MQKIVLAVMAVIAIMSSIGSAVWPFPNFGSTDSGTSESITVGNMLYEYSGLMFIADDQGLFAENSLNVTLLNYVSTVASIKGLENNDTDITLVPEYSIVTEALNKENISVIGNIDKYQSVFLICRKDKGINNYPDLIGKRIGLSRSTIGEFYLGRFLNLKGIHMEDVNLVNMPTTQYVDAITNGSVDAVVVVYKYLDQSRERLGSNLLAWPIQSSQDGYVVLTCRSDWAASHPETINKFLKSMIQAEEYTITHPDGAKAIVQKQMSYTDAIMAAIWPDHHYSLTLDQSLISAMEDEARWMIKNNLTAEKQVPNFLDYIYEDGLKAIKPESVNIIR
jgi:NitT/TauT family transport system substrate-binding protein